MIINCNICKKELEIEENLNKKELKILQYIKEYNNKEGISPSFREIAGAVGLKSISGVDKYVYRLQKKYFLVKKPHKSRSIILIKDFVCG